MAKEFRYTGCWPPTEVLERYPNWVFALNEEGQAEQDETTIKPESQQAYISDETDFTSGIAELADGTKRMAIFSICDDLLDAVYVQNQTQWWGARKGADGAWAVIEETWLPQAQRSQLVALSDARLFPAKVLSNLERSDGRRLEVTIPRQEELPPKAKKAWFPWW